MAQKDGAGRSVRALERGLDLLVAMNRLKHASVMDLARATRLPRPTIYRLLDTLSHAGFITRGSALDRYRLTRQVRTLSDGLEDDEWISEIALPRLAELTRELVWPAALITFDEGRMLVRETTHQASALSIDHGMVGRRLPMLRTAAGRVYLAFCPDNERRAIVEMLCRSNDPDDRAARDSHRLAAVIGAVRHKGYATQDREINPKACGISVPVRIGSRVLGCISIIWIASALPMEEAERRFPKPLQALAGQITNLAPGELRHASAGQRQGFDQQAEFGAVLAGRVDKESDRRLG